MLRFFGTLSALVLCVNACTGDDSDDIETDVTNPSGQSDGGADSTSDDAHHPDEGDAADEADDADETDDGESADDPDDAASTDEATDDTEADDTEADDTEADDTQSDDADDANTDDPDDANEADASSPMDSTPPDASPPDDASAADDDVADVGAPPDPMEPDAGSGDDDAADDDSGAVEPGGDPNFDPEEFELPEEETCSGVEFVDPNQACEDLGGLSLANPQLVTDGDGEWNPGDVATLEVDLVAAPRDAGDPYMAPAVVALFDVESSSFASVNWRTFRVFGLNPGESHTHDLELRLSESAPRGAKVKLHLEPATSDGNTTSCDCPGVEVEGLTLEFEVQ